MLSACALGAAQAARTESCSQPSRFGAGAGGHFRLGAMLRALALAERREEGSSWQQSVLLEEKIVWPAVCCQSVSGACAAGWFSCLKVSHS